MWLLATVACAAAYHFVAREPMDLPVAMAFGFGLFILTPVVYLLALQFEQLFDE